MASSFTLLCKSCNSRLEKLMRTNPRFRNLNSANRELILKLIKKYKIEKEVIYYYEYYKNINKTIKLLFFYLMEKKGISVLDEEWDNLIILDACRYDYFKEAIKKSNLKGKLEYRISKGSDTHQWLITNFTQIYDDILYITANPQVNRWCKDNFPKIVSVWKIGWNRSRKNKEYLNTFLPEITYKYAINSIKNIKHIS